MARQTYYHVAGPHWRPGDALYSFEQLVRRGVADPSDWKWGEERPYGDGSESWIFLFETLAEATEFATVYGGTVLSVDDPEDVRRDPIEDYCYVQGPVPASMLEPVRPVNAAATSLIALLVERGVEGVTLREVAELDLRRLDRVLDDSDFDSDFDQSDRVWDLGPRGIDREILESAARQVEALPGAGAVIEFDKPEGKTIYDEGSRIRLVGWSGLPALHRSLPTLEELAISDPIERTAAFLLTGGCRGRGTGDVAYWAEGINLHHLDVMGRALTALRERGWDIRTYRRGLLPDVGIQVASAPGYPMRPPVDPPPPVERDDYAWPAHSYRFAPALWAAILAAEDRPQTRRDLLGSFTGGAGPTNPLRSFGQPRYYGQPVPDGEAKRMSVRAWAEHGGHSNVLAEAVPGSVELLLDDEPVGAVEIAERLGVRRQTVDQWGQRGLLPERDHTVGGRPAWRWGTIEDWARRTGRLSQPPSSGAIRRQQ